MNDQEQRLKELQIAEEWLDCVLVRLLNERTRLACEALAVMNAVGIVDVTDPDAEVLSPTLQDIAKEGQLGPDAMTHVFRQIRIQVRVAELRAVRANRDRQHLPQGQIAST